MHHCPDTPFLLVGNNMESKSAMRVVYQSNGCIIARTDPEVLESMRVRGQAPVAYEDVSVWFMLSLSQASV
jgi:hypothetical protein